jgi:hypothetical protein
MQPIAAWLDKLGLGHYAQRFAENGIDLSVLRHLTDQDLKDIGVLLGHRRKMLAAIAELSGAVSATLQPTAETERKPHDAAERRQLTVMFCDLVGSTALSARHDPEELREVIGAYHRCCTEAIERNGGFVAKYMGDGVLSYFGYPHAHEHDAERAVRAGLALVEAVPKLTTAARIPYGSRRKRRKTNTVLVCGDHDPGGLAITDTLRDNFNDIAKATGWTPDDLEIVRFGLNKDSARSTDRSNASA